MSIKIYECNFICAKKKECKLLRHVISTDYNIKYDQFISFKRRNWPHKLRFVLIVTNFFKKNILCVEIDSEFSIKKIRNIIEDQT